jgi:archaellum component FlaC
MAVYDKMLESLRDDRNSLDNVIKLFEHWLLIPQVLDEVRKLREEVKQIQMDITALSNAMSKFASDFSAFRTDLTTFLGTVTPADPTQQAQIDGFVQTLATMDGQLNDMDNSVKTPAPPAGGGV